MIHSKSRIALINCPAWGAIPPLGIAAIKAYMVKHGYVAKCFDLNLDFYNAHSDLRKRGFWGADCYNQWTLDYYGNWQDLRFNPGSEFNTKPLPLRAWADEILAFSPDVVGFSTNLTNMPSSLLLAREIKNLRPDIRIVFGGPNVAQDREGNIALRTGVPDVIVNKEGEETFLELMKVWEANGDVSSVAGIGLLVNKEPFWTPMRQQIANLDSLPFPDFEDFPLDKYPGPYDIPIMLSRGCVYHCVFCYEHVFWKKFRTRSAESVVNEMEFRIAQLSERLQLKQSADNNNTPPFTFLFADSLVNGHFKLLNEMCDIIIERGIKVSCTGQATLDRRMDDDFFRKMKKSGCSGLAFGLESASQKVLDSMKKNHKIVNAERVLKSAYLAGMPSTVNVMVGFPSETFRDFMETIFFLFRSRKWISQVSNVTETQLALGTSLMLEAPKFDVTINKDGTWTSPNTGTETDRKRRLKLLHLSMTLFGIPHQKIAEDVAYCD